MVDTAEKLKRAAAVLYPAAAANTAADAVGGALQVAASAAEVGAVHKLRTATRRMEANLELLAALASAGTPLPGYRKEARAVRMALRRVRRTAATVRDLDVQRDLIWYDAPSEGEVHYAAEGGRVRKEAKQLRKHLGKQRDGKAKALTGALRAELPQLSERLLMLAQALEPAVRQAITADEVARCVEDILLRKGRSALKLHGSHMNDADRLRKAVERMSEDSLHTVRKAAKLCRYVAESGSKRGGRLTDLAKIYEAVQEAGGTWHDWLLLRRLSSRFHGKDAALTHRYARHCAVAKAKFHTALVHLFVQDAELTSD